MGGCIAPRHIARHNPAGLHVRITGADTPRTLRPSVRRLCNLRLHQLLHSVCWFNHFWPQCCTSQSPGFFGNSLWPACGRDCTLLDNVYEGAQLVEEAAQRTWNRVSMRNANTSDDAQHETRMQRRGSLRTLDWPYAIFLYGPRIRRQPSES